jgi:DNA-binding transcriptional LysR family regulator
LPEYKGACSDIKALRSSVVVARAGGITRAAEELFVKQPTFSRRIAALEEN